MSSQYDDIPALVVVDASATSNYRPAQMMLSTLYGLNKSFSKKIFLGLEISDAGIAEIRVRIVGNDFIGVPFTSANWKHFVKSFNHISKFFSTGRDNKNMLDQKIVGSGFSVRFTISHRDKAIEIEEDEKKGSEPATKKFRRSIVMKSNTFDILDRYIPIISARISHLETILESWNACMIDVVRRAEVKFAETKKAFEYPDSVLMANPSLTEQDFEEISLLLKDRKLCPLSIAEIRVICQEVVHVTFNSNNYCIEIPPEEQY